jgi:hypothetical protein
MSAWRRNVDTRLTFSPPRRGGLEHQRARSGLTFSTARRPSATRHQNTADTLPRGIGEPSSNCHRSARTASTPGSSSNHASARRGPATGTCAPWRPSLARTAPTCRMGRAAALPAGPDPLRCLSVDGWDTGRQMCWFSQEIQDLETARKRDRWAGNTVSGQPNLHLPRRRRNPGEWPPGLGSVQPIACDATAGSALEAVVASRTIESEEGGMLRLAARPVSRSDHWPAAVAAGQADLRCCSRS